MLKLIVEFGPLFVFLVTYKYSNILFATISMMIVTAACLLTSYFIDKKFSIPLLISSFVLLISGSITIISGDSRYIKMKPTMVYLIFGGMLYGGVLAGRSFVKDVLGSIFSMDDTHWLILSKRFALFFFSMAAVNEFVWRNYSELRWVQFKVFGAVPIAMLFVISQLPFLYRNNIIKDE